MMTPETENEKWKTEYGIWKNEKTRDQLKDDEMRMMFETKF